MYFCLYERKLEMTHTHVTFGVVYVLYKGCMLGYKFDFISWNCLCKQCFIVTQIYPGIQKLIFCGVILCLVTNFDEVLWIHSLLFV